MNNRVLGRKMNAHALSCDFRIKVDHLQTQLKHNITRPKPTLKIAGNLCPLNCSISDLSQRSQLGFPRFRLPVRGTVCNFSQLRILTNSPSTAVLAKSSVVRLVAVVNESMLPWTRVDCRERILTSRLGMGQMVFDTEKSYQWLYHL